MMGNAIVYVSSNISCTFSYLLQIQLAIILFSYSFRLIWNKHMIATPNIPPAIKLATYPITPPLSISYPYLSLPAPRHYYPPRIPMSCRYASPYLIHPSTFNRHDCWLTFYQDCLLLKTDSTIYFRLTELVSVFQHDFCVVHHLTMLMMYIRSILNH